MSLLIQILVSLLVLLSFVLIIFVPVALATPGEWETSKTKVYNLATFLGTLFILTASAQGFA